MIGLGFEGLGRRALRKPSIDEQERGEAEDERNNIVEQRHVKMDELRLPSQDDVEPRRPWITIQGQVIEQPRGQRQR